MRVLITDLDNTLYDWVTFFAKAFGAMLDELSDLLQVDRESLIEEFRLVHQHYGSSEQPFAAIELPCVKSRFPGFPRVEVMEKIDPAFHAFNSVRKRQLRLYDSVESSLAILTQEGCLIIGHTEASKENAYFRLEKLGIREYFHRLYVLEGYGSTHPDPSRAVQLPPPEDFIRVVPKTERKPNPMVLLDICAREGVSTQDAWYVGDSLTRDVSMAKEAGVTSVWARYGTKYEKQLWEELVRITHWTSEDVQREAVLTAQLGKVQPDYIIDSFSGILPLLGATATR